MENKQTIYPEFNNCNLCARHCNVNRNAGVTGFCGVGSQILAARAALHFWEEPCISGPFGSGTVFFSGCSLRCIFCQNHEIAIAKDGLIISVSRLSEIFLELQEKKAANINLVTPTHYVPPIIDALKLAKKHGLTIPVVYNTGSYDTVETIKMLDGLVDIYLPDDKYFSSAVAARYSHAKDYPSVAAAAIKEMVAQTGPPVLKDGLMKRGVIVRHLLLPGKLIDSKLVVKNLWETYHDKIYLSLMNQFTPLAQLAEYPEINRKVTEYEYHSLVSYAMNLGITNAYIQTGQTASESFIPSFKYEGLKK